MRIVIFFLSLFILSSQLFAIVEHTCESKHAEISNLEKDLVIGTAHIDSHSHENDEKENSCDCPNCICNFSRVISMVSSEPNFNLNYAPSYSLSFSYTPLISDKYVRNLIKPPIL